MQDNGKDYGHDRPYPTISNSNEEIISLSDKDDSKTMSSPTRPHLRASSLLVVHSSELNVVVSP
jgi:hypothetical protein